MPSLIGHSGSNKLWIETEKSWFTLIFLQKFKFKKIVINKHSMHIQFQKFMMQIIFLLSFHLSENKDIFVPKKNKQKKQKTVKKSQGVI